MLVPIHAACYFHINITVVHMVVTMELNITNNSKEQKTIKINQNILDCFSKLTADQDHIRLQGEINLLRQLLQLNNDDANNRNLKYSLKRLIRGLGSSKLVSKKGFYTSLTAYFKLHSDMKIDDLLEILEAELTPSNSISKSEAADIYMGRILFCGSLMRSQLLKNYQSEEQQKIIEILLSAGTQRVYLSFVAISFLIDFMEGLDESYMKANIWPVLSKELSKTWANHSLDTFYALLYVNDKFPSLVNKKFIKLNLGAEKIFDPETMNDMLKLITNLPRISSYQHPLYKLFCKKLLLTDYILEFWMGIDQRFVKPSKSIEYLSLELLNHIVPNITDKSLLPSLLSTNFLGHMLNRFKSLNRAHDDEIADLFKKVLAQFIVALKDDKIKSKIQMAVLKKLIYYPGSIMVEATIGVKVLKLITGIMNANGIKKASKFFSAIAGNTELKKIKDEEQSWYNSERIYACQFLSKLLGHPAMSSEHEWRLDQLKFLFTCGFCEVENIELTLAVSFKDSFYSALDHKLPKLSDLRNILSELINYINDLLFVNKNHKLRTPLTDSSIEVWKKMMVFIDKMNNNSENKEAILIFYIMELHMGLQMFSDPEMAVSSINEIHSCFERLTKKKVSKKKKKQKKHEDEEEPEWVDVTVDLLLSFLSKNSHLLRSVVRCVFPHVCSELTSTSIHQILEALDPQDESGPLVPQDLENDNLSESESNPASDSDEESDEDDENSVTENGVNKNNDSEDDDDDDDYDEDDEGDEDETFNDRLRLAVRQALGDASAQTDVEDVDIDAIDEEEGKRLDESLAAAFRIIRESRSSSKKKQGKAAETLTHFRTRVIDLLEIYLDSGPSMALTLDMLVPLFTLLEFCIKDPHQKPLKNRVRNCLKKLSTVKKFKDTKGVDEKLLIDLFKILIEKGERSTAIYQEMADKLAECCPFLIRCAQHANVSSTTIIYILNENLTSFFKKRDCILPVNLFKNILQLNWDGNWKFTLLIVDFAFDQTIRSFRRGQAIELLIIFYRNHSLIKSEENIGVRQKIEKKIFLNSIKLFEELIRQNDSNSDSSKTQNSVATKEIRQKFVGLLWKLLNVIYPNHIPKAWDWSKIASAMTEFRKNNSLSNDAKGAYNKLASHIGAEIKVHTQVKKIVKEDSKKLYINGVDIKDDNESLQKPLNTGERNENNNNSVGNDDNDRDDDDNDGDDDDDDDDDDNSDNEAEKEALSKKAKKELKKKMKNRSKQGDRQKLKKETRELREKAMSKGLEPVDFSSATFVNGAESMENGNVKEESEDNNETERSPAKKRLLAESLDPPRKNKKKKHV